MYNTGLIWNRTFSIVDTQVIPLLWWTAKAVKTELLMEQSALRWRHFQRRMSSCSISSHVFPSTGCTDNYKSTRSLFFYTPLSFWISRSWSLCHHSMGRCQETPWTGQTFVDTRTWGHFLASPVHLKQAFGLWEETRPPGENPHRYGRQLGTKPRPFWLCGNSATHCTTDSVPPVSVT